MDLHDFLGRLENVKKSGNGYTARCPGHDDKKNSLSVNLAPNGKINVNCFAACDIKTITEGCGIKVRDLYPPDQQGAPARRGGGNGQFGERDIQAKFDYLDENGELRYQVVRFPGKNFRQRRPDPDMPGRWIWNLEGVEPLLWHISSVLDAFAKNKTVFLVEGEKDVLSLEALGLTATTNSGGAQKWSPKLTKVLKQGRVVIIPDNDPPGIARCRKLRKQLPDSALLILPGLAHHGDVTDWIEAGGEKENLIALARQAFIERDETPATDTPLAQHYIPLGHNEGNYYFLSGRSRQIVALSASSLSRKTSFLQLAPLAHWEDKYSGKRGPDYMQAAEDLISYSVTAGLFDERRRRGRGAWWDAGDTVLHMGDALIVNGAHRELLDHKSRFIYELRPRLAIEQAAPLTDAECQRFIDMCQLIRWDSPAMAVLFAGWVALAPICGILKWRPHLLITGPRGAGKTVIIDNIVGEILGGFAAKVQSVTTEAGLRQMLGHDALPVLFDEAETGDNKSQWNIQHVLDLARQSSSEGGAAIVKGTVGGKSMSFMIRSMFCLGSISVCIRRQADQSRFTVLSIQGGEARSEAQVAQYDALKQQMASICTPEFTAGLVARSCGLASIIRANAETFAIAVAKTIGDRRLGDQLGTLLAGYWSLWTDKTITIDNAVQYLEGLNIEAVLPQESGGEEDQCLDYILEQIIRVETGNGPRDRSIGELIEIVSSTSGTGGEVSQDGAHSALLRHGIDLTTGGILISNTHSGIKLMMENTPWEINWGIFLKRIKGASVPKQPRRFAGSLSRVTFIPFSAIDKTHSNYKIFNESHITDEDLF